MNSAIETDYHLTNSLKNCKICKDKTEMRLKIVSGGNTIFNGAVCTSCKTPELIRKMTGQETLS